MRIALLAVGMVHASAVHAEDVARSLPQANVEPPPAEASARIAGMVEVRHQSMIDGYGKLQETGFVLARARIAVDGRLGEKLGYHLSAAADYGSPELFAAFVAYSPWWFLSMRAGQMRVPFSRAGMTPEERLLFPERSIATQEFGYFRDIGASLRAHSRYDRLELVVGAWNGAGPNRVNDNRDPMLLLRIAGTPIGQAWLPAEGDPQRSRNVALSLGGTATVDYVPAPLAYGYASGSAVPAQAIANRDMNNDGRVDDIRVVQLAADIAVRFRGLALECELYQRREAWKQVPYQAGVAPLPVQNRFRGWFAQLSYFILAERLLVAARAGVARLSPLPIGGRRQPEGSCLLATGASQPCALPYADVRSELAGLVAFQYTRLRLSGTYSRLRWSSDGAVAPAPATENRITLQAQWIL